MWSFVHNRGQKWSWTVYEVNRNRRVRESWRTRTDFHYRMLSTTLYKAMTYKTVLRNPTTGDSLDAQFWRKVCVGFLGQTVNKLRVPKCKNSNTIHYNTLVSFLFSFVYCHLRLRARTKNSTLEFRLLPRGHKIVITWFYLLLYKVGNDTKMRFFFFMCTCNTSIWSLGEGCRTGSQSVRMNLSDPKDWNTYSRV